MLAFWIGPGDEIAARRIWEKISHHKINFVCTDGNFSYNKVLPSEINHVVDKAETSFVESKNSDLRHYNSCLARKTKAYAKSKKALNRAMKFFMFKDIICR